jgi:hypothetical protein
MTETKDYPAAEATGKVRRLVRISGTYYISIPPEFVRAHNLKAGDFLMVEHNSVVTVAPIPKGKVLFPKEEILLPYPQGLDTDEESRLSIAAFAKNYQRIHEYTKQERPDWDLLEVNMETVKKEGRRFFKVTQIINKTPSVDK